MSSYTHAVYLGKEPILIGERINPTGKKRFKEALLAEDIGYILREGLAEQERGTGYWLGEERIDRAALELRRKEARTRSERDKQRKAPDQQKRHLVKIA